MINLITEILAIWGAISIVWNIIVFVIRANEANGEVKCQSNYIYELRQRIAKLEGAIKK